MFGFNAVTIISIILFIIILVLRIKAGFKNGFVKELANIISMVIALILGFLIYKGVKAAIVMKFGTMIAALILILVMLAIFGVNKLIFKILKVFASLPVVSGIDKFFGIIAGIIEACLIMAALIIALLVALV